ncbi:hypothetical protein K458DRAFT_119530 [Lentithecium fluviatile CBS 122367]|uniref:Mid2 domain-containing protein n=1 Tax=Lentithecium fluviatile CBS 122367 TaxID=1168545 RepID=A0A6G1IMU4_9PLEO|nr:hypothetical protein K458DRAFT_119530 [Lentithecium fluviatile CBS 122367]
MCDLSYAAMNGKLALLAFTSSTTLSSHDSLPMSIDNIDQGWAIRRNGSCHDHNEKECGETRFPFRACCPNGYECPKQNNLACCLPSNPPGSNNCSVALQSKPRCANATWDLFDNGGYFCCARGLPGYNISGTNGCASPGFVYKGNEQALSTIQAGQGLTSSTTSTATSAPPSSTEAPPTDTPSRGFSTPAGTIAGAAVGGAAAVCIIVLMVWFVLRQRPQKKDENQYAWKAHADYAEHQLDDAQAVHEADGGLTKDRNVKELSANQSPIEMPAS